MQEDHPITAFFSMLTSIFSAIFAVISIKDIQIALGVFSSLIAILSGCFAIRYYYLSAKNIKKDEI